MQTSSEPLQVSNFILGPFQMPLNISPAMASHQIPSTSTGVLGTRMPMQQSLEGQQTASLGEESVAATVTSSQQVVHSSTAATTVSASAVLSSLEESSEGDLLSRSDLTQIFMKSCSRKNMAVLMTRKLFSEEIRMSSNVAGRKKKQLDPKVIDFIRRKVFLFFPSAHVDTSKE